MKIGLNWPYDSRATDETWRRFKLLEPTEITISSHEPDAVYDRLLSEYPGDRLQWHVRAKGNRAWWPRDIDSAEWANERSLLNRTRWLLARGITPWLILANEPDIELAAEPVDDAGNRARGADSYLAWAADAIAVLRRAVPEAKIALAPISQGNPDRFAYWLRRYQDSGLLSQVAFWCEHAYTDGRPFDDPDWGGRPLAYRPANLPVRVTETNDNGAFAAQDLGERAADFAGYARFLRLSGVVESLSLFTLPGGAQDAHKPSWWFVTPQIVTAVRDVMRLPIEPPIDPPEEPTMPNTIRAVDVSSHQTPSLPALQQWIAEGCQLLIVKSYQRAESGLQQTTRDHVANARAAVCWTLPYVWLYRSVDPRESVRTSLELFRSTGEDPRIMFLDCETYENSDGSIDPGPNVDQIMAAANECQVWGVAPVLYTGTWWLNGHLEGDKSKLAGMPVWLANYSIPPSIELPAPLGLRLIMHQYTSTPVDWSICNLDALTELSEPGEPGEPGDPCADLKASIRGELVAIDQARLRIAELIA